MVRKPGFASVAMELTADRLAETVEVRLNPAPDVERITVSATGDERIPAVPSSQFAIPREQLQASGSLVLDDILRQAPGLSLFRRSSSLFANPTSQGVSMRGIGASGPSRAVVLLDGIPLNDPFGGWVYWNQVPLANIESAQVFNGAESDTYGTGALAGVVNLTTRQERTTFGTLETSYGSKDTPSLSFAGGVFPKPWGIAASGQVLRTHGYILVPEGQRGLVDTPAGTADLVGSVTVSRTLGRQGRFFAGGTSFGESRKNGTPATFNNTRIPSFRLGADWTSPVAGSFSGRAYGSYEVFNQTFSSVAANRNSEFLTNRQRSPSQQIGFAGQWQRIFQGRNNVTAGVEYRDVRGHSAETTFAASGAATANLDAGGRQRVAGVFVQDAFYFARNWLLTAGARGDFWLNSRGFMNRQALPTGIRTASAFSDRSQGSFSPRLSLLRNFSHNIAASASFYRAFRAPTLNELYRNFRVGNTATNANPALNAERLSGGEAGISLRNWLERVTLRGTFFWSEIADPIANVTLSFTPPSCSANPASCATITRQRQNLGSTRARGVELSAEIRLPKHLQVSGEYIFTDSTVVSFPANTALQGLQVPQVPKHSFNVQASYVGAKWTVGIQTRFLGNQFDDDQNLLPLGRAFIADANVSREIVPHVSMFFAAQNLFNDTYNVARTPVVSVGPPAIVRGGFRFVFP